MIYELWSTETDRLLGTIDVPRHVSHEIGERVPLKMKGYLETPDGSKYNAIEALVCRMKINDKDYWALETNLPLRFVMKLEGFTPKLERPSLAQMFFLDRHAKPNG
jgi:hypothetical protein